MMSAQLQQASGTAASSGGSTNTPSGLTVAAAAASANKASEPSPPEPVTEEEPLRNHAAESNSPFVRAQADTPVHWQLLNQEAIDRAKRENKLIFLHVGFFACHYCHTTLLESFSNPSIASILNTSFIPIVVDREERPDIDAIYWNYLQLVNSSAGWPINVFLTPDLEPVFGGTYFPGAGSDSHDGRGDGQSAVEEDAEDEDEDELVGFLGILKKLRQSWTDRESQCREEARETVVQLRKFASEGTLGPRGLLKPNTPRNTAPAFLSRDLDIDIDQLDEALTQLKKTFDPINGGFGVVPKFVTPAKYSFLLQLSSFPSVVRDIIGEKEVANAADMALFTLRKLQKSALHDHLLGGFSRASHTINWTLPHFEKLVPDNALLLNLYLDAWLHGKPTTATTTSQNGLESSLPEGGFLPIIYSLANYLSSAPIQLAGGGFATSEAADSYYRRGDNHTREGAYYVWTRREFDAVVSGSPNGNSWNSSRNNSGSSGVSSGSNSGNSNNSNGNSYLDTRVAAAYWNVLEHGNVDREDDPNDEFINQNVLYANKDPAELARHFGISREEVLRVASATLQKLAAHRKKERVRPAVGSMVIVSANGMVITALARVGAVLKHGGYDAANGDKYIRAAEGAARFIQEKLWDAELKQLYRTYSYEQRGKTLGFAEDYVFLIEGLLALYEATGALRWLKWADELQQTQIELFYDSSETAPTTTHSASGGFYRTRELEPFNILRIKDGMDTTLPATNGVAAANLFRLGSLLGSGQDNPQMNTSSFSSTAYSHLARDTIHAFEVEMMQHAWLFPSLLAEVVSARLGGLQFVSVGRDLLPTGGPDSFISAYFRRPRGGLRTLLHVPATEAEVEATGNAADKEVLSWLQTRNPTLATLLSGKSQPVALAAAATGTFVLDKGTWRKATEADLEQKVGVDSEAA